MDKITRENVLEAVLKIEREGIKLHPSTDYDVFIYGKAYPPKEVMRYANFIANGKNEWLRHGGEETNKILEDEFGFEVLSRSEEEKRHLTQIGFIDLLKKIGRANAIIFFECISQLLIKFDLKEGDTKLTFSTSKLNKCILIVGQRYSLGYFINEENPWQFISEIAIQTTEDIQITKFEGKPEAFYYRSRNSSVVKSLLPSIIGASEKELTRTVASGYRKYNNSVFEKAVFDSEYRNELFDKAYNSHNYWAFHCNPDAWNVIAEMSEYNDGFWQVAKQHENQIKAGDEFLMWVSGTQAGIYAFGRVIVQPKNLVEAPERIQKFASKPSEFSGETVRVKLLYSVKLVNNPITRKSILESDILQNGSVEYNFFNRPQGVTSRDLSGEIFNKLKSMINTTDESEIIKKFKAFLDNKNYKRKNTSDIYIKKMPKIQNWLVSNGVCPKNFNIWQDVDLISKIDQTLKTNKLVIWSEINKKENENGFFRAPWNIWVEYNKLVPVKSTLPISKAEINPNKIDFSRNIVLYGPPGTGKTFKLLDYRDKYFTDQGISLSSEEQLKELLTSYPYWKVIAAILGTSTTPINVEEILSHPLAKAKFKLDMKTKPNNIVWGELLGFADDASTTLVEKYRRGDKLFTKFANSKWSIAKDKMSELSNYIGQELIDLALNPLVQPVKGSATKMRYDFITFHQKYSYEDFIEGIKPVLKSDSNAAQSGDLQFELKRGIFYKSCLKAMKLAGYDSFEESYNAGKENRESQFKLIKNDTSKQFAIFIDEINRANISAVFGELITLLEEDKRMGSNNEMWVELPYSNEKFCVPANLYLIGTMNTADRSIALLDIALRRRFEFKALYPLYTDSEWWAVLLQELNKAIYEKKNKNPDFFIGHAFFIKKLESDKSTILKNNIIPLLLEYFQNNVDSVLTVLKSAKISCHQGDIKDNFQIVLD